ncbi:MAG: hypothetical protein PUG76_05720 [Prevotellaceae bacterium]|nr:hypothetical protein [Prevotellaceae bacterium]
MRKLYFFILSMFAFGLAQEAMAQSHNIPDATTLSDAPSVYIKNTRSNHYVSATGEGGRLGQTGGTPNRYNLFRFVKTGENAYKIFSIGRMKWLVNATNGTYTDSESTAQTWYIERVNAQNQFAINSQSEATGETAWNDLNRNAVTYWMATDAGSMWYIETPNDGLVNYNAYVPGERMSSLQAGTEFMILNTCVAGNQSRTGFLQASATNLANQKGFLPYANVSLPLTFQEGTDYYIFTLENSSTPGKWYMKNKATQKYVAPDGSITSATGVDLTIEEFSAASGKAAVSSLNDDGTATGSTNITTANKVWKISNGETTMWNGDPNNFTTWGSAHPYAFYTVNQSETSMIGQMSETLTTTTNKFQAVQGKVGAPVEATYNALSTASSVTDKTTMTFYNQAFNAVYAAEKGEVKMPEDGKAYAVVSVTNPTRNDPDAYMVVGSNARITMQTGTGYNTDNAAKFVARKQSDGKYVLSNGRYNYTLQFTGNTERNLTAGYDAQYSPISIVSMDRSKAEVKLLTRRNATTPSVAIIVKKSSNPQVIDKIGSTDWTLNQEFSIRFRLEEVGYPVSTTLRASADIEGAAAMSTWSAPYASVCPEGVTAYYASENGTVARMTAVEGAIPANQGVVLVGAAAGEKTPLPVVAGDQVGTITGNLLGNTAGQAAAIAQGCFVLSQKNNVTAFYKLSNYDSELPANRAYLRASTAGGGSRQLVFGFDDATGIPTLQDAAQQNQPTYDLSGRAVSAKRQGLYIRGGKKFIVK